jgi:cytochrome P450
MAAFREMPGSAALLPTWAPLPGVRRTNAALAAMNRIVYGMIDARRAEAPGALAGRLDLLSALVRATDEAGGGMSREQLRDEVLTLFLAGHETTSHALTWAWYLLSRHPEAEARVHAELDAVLGGREATVADLPRLEYTSAVFDEAMRLYPPAPVISRTASEDATVGGYSVPAGAELLVWIYCLHHDGRWFPEPERFRPERFLPDAPDLPKCAYVPFGAGTRACVGKHFALMEAKLILATVAQRFRLRLAPDQRVEKQLAVTLSPRHGMRMTLDSR